MTDMVSIPLWLVIIGCLLVAWALLDHILLPGVRWYIRRRVNIVIKEVNKKLDLQLPAFKLTKRKMLIDRLKYDSRILENVKEYCKENNVPNEVAMEKVERYAKEIIPSFNAYIYFRIGRWLSKSISRLLYRVRVGFVDEEGLEKIEKIYMEELMGTEDAHEGLNSFLEKRNPAWKNK